MWEHGKLDKALKIYQHALALDPTHPDVLNEYGEFLEKTQHDVVKAEHMYCRALVLSPKHSRALSNRKRTLPLVEEVDQTNFNRIERKRDTIIKIPDNHPGLRRMKKESYFRHIHHTTAIEGNTFTLSQTRSFVETRIVISGKSIMEHNEILGLDAALHYVNSTLVHRIGAISIQDIKDIQKHVLGFVDPIGSGVFRTTQVFVGEHIPPAASEVEKHMKEFIEWLNSDDALSLHPIEFAALAHYKLVYIHPFYDGNGRTSRLLMNLILMQAGYPPIIIMKGEKQEYFELLETANAGDIRPFIRFIAKCTERTLDEYIWATSENPPSMTRIFARDDGRTIILDQMDDNFPKPETDNDDSNWNEWRKHSYDKNNKADNERLFREYKSNNYRKNEPVDNDINNNDENNNGESIEDMPSFTDRP